MQVEAIFNERGSVRYETTGADRPKPGDLFIDEFGDEVRFDEIGLFGMWACTNTITEFQSLCRPHSLKRKATQAAAI